MKESKESLLERGEIDIDLDRLRDDIYRVPKKYSCKRVLYSDRVVWCLTITLPLIMLAISAVLLLRFLAPPPDVGAVASSNEYATKAGIKVLKDGGNAFDAMVVMQLVMTVTEPYSSGIGGGAFVMWSNDKGKVRAFDGREEAPEDLPGLPVGNKGGEPVGTPGTVALLDYLLKEHGSWDWARCAQPAIKLAREGWVLDPYGAQAIANNADDLALFPSSAALYLNPDNSPKQAGTLMTNPDLADTLQLLADKGMSVFYTGEIAQDIVSAVVNDSYAPGVLKMSDLAQYRAVEREPIKWKYNGFTLYSMNMPSSGGATAALILNILSNFDISRFKQGSIKAFQYLLNAMTLGYADRNQYMGDADWVDVPVEGLIDKDYAKERSKLMDCKCALNKVLPGVPPGAPGNLSQIWKPSTESMHTTHFSIMDKKMNFLAVTSTIEQTFGNFMVVPGRGFLLNNELNDFAESGPNAAEGGKRLRRTALYPLNNTKGGKRPMSSMTPVVVLRDKDPRYALGSPGGSRIICSVVNVLMDLLEFGINVNKSVHLPRIYSNNGDTYKAEEALIEDSELIQGLYDLGFNTIEPLSGTSAGSVNVVFKKPDDSIGAVADARRDGVAGSFGD